MLGDGSKKAQAKVVQPEITKTIHINFHATGVGVDQIDWHTVIADLSDEKTPFVITGGNVNVYYTTEKEKK